MVEASLSIKETAFFSVPFFLMLMIGLLIDFWSSGLEIEVGELSAV